MSERKAEGIVDSVAGVILWTEDVEGLASFYREVLGLAPRSVRPDFVAFSFGDVRLSIGRHSKVQGKAKDPYRVMVNLGVDDIHRAYHRLEGRGVVFLRSPERERWGGWVATFQDPDGNILQLLQQSPAEDALGA